MADHIFSDVIEPNPLDMQEFDRLVTERLNKLENAKDNHLVIGYEPYRDDTMSHVQAVKMWDDIGYRVEWATNTGAENRRIALKIYHKDHLSEEESIRVFKEILVDFEMPDKEGWEDTTEMEMYAGWAFLTVRDYSKIKNPTEQEQFAYVEALKYIIDEVDEPKSYEIDAMKAVVREKIRLFGSDGKAG